MIPRVPRRAKWDCATILSTYTNTENHPKVLSIVPTPSRAASVSGSAVPFSKATGAPKLIKLSAKTGVPVGVPVKGASATAPPPPASEESSSDGEEEGEEEEEKKNLGAARPKEETPEERKERKRLVKEARKVRLVLFVNVCSFPPND